MPDDSVWIRRARAAGQQRLRARRDDGGGQPAGAAGAPGPAGRRGLLRAGRPARGGRPRPAVPGRLPDHRDSGRGCLSTTFVWMQHHGVVRAVAGGPAALRQEMLGPLCRGERRAGVALAGLLPGPPRLRARAVGGGYVLDGTSPWVTGWGHIDTLHVAARRTTTRSCGPCSTPRRRPSRAPGPGAGAGTAPGAGPGTGAGSPSRWSHCRWSP